MPSTAAGRPAMATGSPFCLSEKAKAVLLMLGAVSLFAFLDSSAKLAGREVPSLEVVWFRFAIHFVLVALFLNPWRAPEAWRTSRPWLQLLRASIQIVCTGLNFLALTQLQIAQTLSIQFAGPIFVTLLSVLILGEHVAGYRWAAILASFIGVLVITRPAPGSFDPAFLIIILSVLIGAGYSILTRRIAGSGDSAGSMLLIMAAVPAIIVTPMLPFFWQWPTHFLTWVGLVGSGVFGAISHYLYIKAHTKAPASFLAPLQYFQFMSVLVLGFFIFGDVPTFWTFLGSAILVASGLFTWWREKRAGAKPDPEVVAIREQAE